MGLVSNGGGAIGLLLAGCLFFAVSLKWGGRPKSIREFFHQKNPLLNATSLTAANLGLGTGLMGVLLYSNIYGALCIVLPLMMFTGQWLYSRMVTQFDPKTWSSRGTILSGLNDKLNSVANSNLRFQWIASFFIILTQIMALSYEVYASADWITIMVFPNASTGSVGKITVMGLALSIVTAYIITGGFRTTQITDLAQCIVALPFIVTVCVVLLSSNQAHAAQFDLLSNGLPHDIIAIVSLGTVLLAPFTGQIYGMLNHTFASHQDTNDEQRKVFRWARIGVVLLYEAIIAIALYVVLRGGSPMELIKQWLISKSISAPIATVLIVVAMIGMVMSTVDTLVIAITQAGYEGLLGLNSRQDQNGSKLKELRKRVLIVYVVVFSILIALSLSKANALALLYAVATPCEALAPLIVCLIVLAKRDALEIIARPVACGAPLLYLFYLLVFATSGTAALAVLFHAPWVGTLGICAFSLSTILSAFVCARARRLTALA